MKRSLLISAVLLGSLVPFSAQAGDACKSVVCMAGLAGVAGGSVAGGCDSAEKDFFKIIVKRKGKFRPSDTARKRRDYLNSCEGSNAVSEDGSNPEAIDAVIKKFGRVRR